MPAEAAPVAVRARGWGWRHASRTAWAVRGVDLAVAPGERVMLLGPSGSGKSTLLAGLAGLLDDGPDGTGEQQGQLLLDGVPARRARAEAIGTGSARTGLLLQDPSAQTVLARCGDDVAFGLENHALPAERIPGRVVDALAGVGFPYPVEHPTARLSGGERQRLALAGVLALRPGLLLLDEPTAMLDPDGTDLLRDRVRAVLAATGATCVLVEHRVAGWLDLVDRVVVLAAGDGVIADGAPAEVLRRRAAELAAAGVWVPDAPPAVPPRRRPAPDAAPDGDVVLTAERVAVRRPGADVDAVRDVDLSVRAGRATCVVGPNGAGKSSLALALAGLLPPAAGEVRAGPGLAAGLRTPHPHRWRPRELVTRIGTVFQEPEHQFVARTCLDELAVGPLRAGAGPDRARARASDLLDRLGLARLARANPFTLSGGEQRRLSVATALATGPRVLVLDEPTFGQDARTWAELVALLTELLAEGSALVAVTHDLPFARALADQVLTLRAGRPAPTSDPRATEPTAERAG